MRARQCLFLLIVMFFLACQESHNSKRRLMKKELHAPTPSKTTKTKSKLILKNPNLGAKPVFIAPEPRPPYDPYDPVPYPIDPPGYIPEPEPISLLSTPKTIRDSLVLFPVTNPVYGNSTEESALFIGNILETTPEWKYLEEIGIDGKIYFSVLIDTKGKVRELTFLRFTSSELEILKPQLTSAVRQMSLWTPAKNEQGEPVVSEVLLVFRFGIQ